LASGVAGVPGAPGLAHDYVKAGADATPRRVCPFFGTLKIFY
jgi:hypothetical protein